MKRTIYLLAALAGFALLLISVLSSCESNQTQTSGKAPTLSAAPETSAVPLPPEDGSSSIEPEPESVPDEEPGSKILVAYFSRMGNMEFDENVDATTSASVNSIDGEYMGNTQLLAQMAQETTGGDLFSIETVEKYPSDYRETTNIASTEKREDSRPALATHVDNMESYDTVVLIYPNWWGGLPQAVKTFLEEYDFSGKTIYPLCTHEGSGLSNTENEIAELCSGATVSEGLSVRGGSAVDARDQVVAWLDGLKSSAPAENPASTGEKSIVYFTDDISSESMLAIYKALQWSLTGKAAVKLSTGEPPASNYLRPELIKDVVDEVDGTIVECNTAYGGSRAQTAMHYQVAADHGFTAIADFQIQDENGSMTLPVTGGTRLTENYVGKDFADYDSYLVLSHFKGHAMAGFGGAIKNISIGLGSAEGKCLIHTGGKSHTSPWGGDQTAFTESMAEAGKSVSDYLGGGERIVYINVMNRISIDCDCDGNPHEPDIHDIGILASADPVALDQACIDIVSQAQGNESLMQRIERQQGIRTLEHAEEIGLGSRTYDLVSVDG